MSWAADRGESHAYPDVVFDYCDSVNEAEVDDVYRYLRVVAVAEGVHHSVDC